MFRLSDFNYHDKVIFLRADLNSPVKDGKIISDARFRAVLHTIRYLLEHKAKVVIGTHQSKPYEEDYLTTEQHAEILSSLLGVKVKYVDDIFGKCARDAIKALKASEVLMLENLRFAAEETKQKPLEYCERTHFVRKLSPLIAVSYTHLTLPTICSV